MNDGEHTERLKDTCMDLFRQKKYKEALECFDRVLKIDPDDFLSLRQKGILLSYPEIPDKNAYLTAMEYLNRALDHRPGDYRTLQQKAEVASKLKKWDQTIDIYEELLERNPRNWRCWRGKGIAYADSGQPGKAIKCFDKAIELNKRDAISLRRKGVALSFMGKDEEAVTWFDKALNIPHRRRYNTLRDMGVSLVRLGRFSEAMIYLDKAVKENPLQLLQPSQYSKYPLDTNRSTIISLISSEFPADSLRDFMFLLESIFIVTLFTKIF